MDVTAAPALDDRFAPPCPKCKAPLSGIGDEGAGVCGACATALEFVLFPARRRAKPVARAARSLDGEATCFFHAQNQAAAVCDSCGRYVCAVCELPGDEGRRLCPPCVSAGRKKTMTKADEVVTYDSIAMTLALLPVLMWPLTLVTAPAALCMAIYGWKKPRSLVRPGSWRLVAAMIIATLEIGGWIAFGLALWVG
ncbi:MAG: hypothetical protein ACAH89_09770 [Rariglobus sp.]|nr:hypothetical protein [Rariglobus sp.]